MIASDDAERLLVELGVCGIDDLDLPVIAHLLGLSIRVAPLQSCEARLVAAGDRGIITVRRDSSLQRRRFSVAHEIGHWRYHRNSVLMCQSKDIGEEREAASARERVADRFASSLLMPGFLFLPLLERAGRPTFEAAMALAGQFQVSVTAAARRIVNSDKFPCVLASYGTRRRNWYTAAPQLGDRWVPSFELDARSRALDFLVRRDKPATVIRSNAAIHFSRQDASRFDIEEQFWSPAQGEVLAMLTFRKNPEL